MGWCSYSAKAYSKGPQLHRATIKGTLEPKDGHMGSTKYFSQTIAVELMQEYDDDGHTRRETKPKSRIEGLSP